MLVAGNGRARPAFPVPAGLAVEAASWTGMEAAGCYCWTSMLGALEGKRLMGWLSAAIVKAGMRSLKTEREIVVK